jgi:hypothetical protein
MALAELALKDGTGVMTSERVTLASGRCIIDIEPQATESGEPRFVAHLSLLDSDGDGAVVRPLVGPDGRRIKIHATSERLAVRVAMSYLEGRFGRILPPEPATSLATATVGDPFITG